MEDFKWAFNVFGVSIIAFASVLITGYICINLSLFINISVDFLRAILFLIPIAYFLVLGYFTFKLKNRIISFGLLLNLFWVIAFYFEVINGID
jgi:hypothetical protein